ncbi:putative Hybrid PKS-NRPS biosynthetic cluster [Amphichorda felina]
MSTVPDSMESSDHTPETTSPGELSLSSSSAPSVAPGETIPNVHQDPSVITGIAFRLPGAKTLDQLWDNVVTKKDLQRKMPHDRFNVDAFYHPLGTNKGTTNSKYGYFLEEPLSEFDNEFFRISRQEAESMDPQQRLLLEVVYEALEDAGIPPSSLRGSRTSVHVGSFSNDYMSMTNKDLAAYPKYTVTGTGNAILSNRISYFYDLHGPSITIDTACSSSLVCFHLGSQSLRSGEADIAIVAGSALHFDPNIYITMTDFGMLSSDGRCRTFDRDGSGYVRGEGVCAMVLRRRSSAEAAGSRIHAVVRGTGSNHDGSKAGLTLPNGAAQARLIRQVYKDAGLDVSGTEYFEAHGTGTKAGDPIEAKAIGSVFAAGRDRPLYVGSIKSNLGHLEGASGLVGITKAVMSVSSGKILPNMHFNNPNPDIDFEGLKLKVPTEVEDWPANSTGIRRASVNSFGYGGSNAHIILENYTPRPQVRSSAFPLLLPTSEEEVQTRPYLLPLTAHNDGSAKNNASAVRRYIEQTPGVSPADLALSYSLRRSELQLRSYAIGSSRESLLEGLDSAGNMKWITPLNNNKSTPLRLGFVFTGQGAQWHAMGRELIHKSPLFRQTIDKCDRILSGLPDGPEWSVLGELLKTKEDSRLGESLLSQPLCAALQLAIVDLLKAWGIVPTAVIGHSSGEIAAAYAAGILSFRNAIICAYYRGLYMSGGSNLPQKGAMMAVGVTLAEGGSLLEPYTGRIALAAVNSPTSLTLSGDEDAVVELKGELDRRGVFNRRLRVEQAFHSHHMDPLAPGFEAALSRTPGFQANRAHGGVRLVSSVTGRDSSARDMGAGYWAANMTGVVRFADALTGILLDENDEPDVDILVEIGAHPALRGPSLDVARSVGPELPYVASLSRDKPAFESLLACAGELHGLGFNVDLAAANSHQWISSNSRDDADDEVDKLTPGRILHGLPSYAWDHSQHWAETRAIRQHRLRPHRHSILGAVVPGTLDAHPVWRNYIKLSELPWLGEHVVQGKILFPAAGYISMALEAVAALAPGTSMDTNASGFQIRDVAFKSALVLDDGDAGTEVLLELQPLPTSAKNTSNSWHIFSISSYGERDVLVEHCRGQVRAECDSRTLAASVSAASLAETRRAADRRKASALYYKQLRSVGLDYGENFRLVSGSIESGPNFSLARLGFDPSRVVTCEADRCIIHPTALDASFHAIFAAIETCTGKPLDESFVPTFIRSAGFSASLLARGRDGHPQDLAVHCHTEMPGTRVGHSTLRILDSNAVDGEHKVLVQLNGLEVTALGNESSGEKRELFFNIHWRPLFSQLDTAGDASAYPGTLPAAINLWAHEVPDASILYLTSSKDAVADALRQLGGSNGERRKFGRLSVWSETDHEGAQRAVQELEPSWPGLVEYVQPEAAGQYDLVVLEPGQGLPVAGFLKPGAHVATVGDASLGHEEGAFRMLFGAQDFTVWRALADVAGGVSQKDMEQVTVLISPRQVSATTQAIVSSIESSYPGPVRTLALGTDQPSTTGVISLVSLDEDVLADPATEAEHLAAIQALVDGPASNVVWLTRDAAVESRRPEQAIINGLFRTIRSENDWSRFATLDLEATTVIPGEEGEEEEKDVAAAAAHIAQRAVQVLNGIVDEDELAERNKVLLVPRARGDDARNSKLPFAGNRQVSVGPIKQEGRPLALKIGKKGLLDTLVFDDDEDVADPDLADDEVEVEVRASALNFRDVAAAIGIIEDHRLGDEAAGVVVRTGKAVSADEFKPGDRVVTARPGQGAHRTLVRSPAMLTHKIGDMAFDVAASFPLILVTATYSLCTIGRLQKGEYCLIHSAAGGVGQMAVQVAQWAGAKVIATVGSQEKRAFIRDKFGIADDMIFSSRDDSFVEGVMSVTGGRGCDVALNSLAGELLHATWKCIAPLGRLIEIGKRDIHENTRLEMDPFRHNVTYASVDIITLRRVNPVLLSELFRESFDLVQSGEVKPPSPMRTFTFAESQKAFRTLQIGKFFGKIVLTTDGQEHVPITPASFADARIFNPAKSYLLVGGLGGIGRSLSEWMFRRGARRLAFLSRSGARSQEAQDTVAWLNERGVETSVFQANVDRLEEVQGCIEHLRDSLGGIFQAAMVLRDGPFGQMTAGDWRACVHPKVLGTRNLHLASRGVDLDFFVCFSSMSSIIGSAGQSNYAAANAYVDALMSSRKAHGLAGTTMNVGVVGDVGAVAEDEALAVILDRLGYEPISQNELFYQVEEAVLTSKDPGSPAHGVHQVITGLNTSRKDVYWASKALFRNIYANLDLKSDDSRKGTKSLSAQLSAAETLEDKTELLTSAFIEKVSAVMGVPAESIQKVQPLTAYGLDSIVAVEFRKWFSTAASVDVPLFDILGSKSIAALTAKAAESLRSEGRSRTSAAEGPDAGSNNAASADKRTTAEAGKRRQGSGGGFEIVPRVRKTQTPLSSYQSRLWFLHNISADQNTLHFVGSFLLKGRPQLATLQAALDEMASRNDSLRTIYFEGDSFAEQTTADKFQSQIAFEDITAADDDVEAALAKGTERLRSLPIDIESGQSVNACLFKVGEDDYTLVFSLHHINLDNGSTKTFLDQFTQIYDAISRQRDLAKISAPRLSYADFAVWHNDFLHSSPQVRADLDWWKDTLRGAPDSSALLPFAPESQRPETRAAERLVVEASVSSTVLRRLKRISAASDATPFHFLITAFRAFIYRYTEEEDLTLLMVDGTRPHPEVSDIMGFFVNLIPLRLKLESESCAFEKLLSQVSRATFDALKHNSAPFDAILENSGIKRSAAHFPISQVMVNYQIYGKPPVVSTADFDITDVSFQDIPTPGDLSLEAIEDPAVGLALKIQYDAALYQAHEMDRFLENFTVFLADVARDHRQPVNEIALSGPKELRHLREHCWGLDVTADPWQGKSIVTRILDVAQSQPAAVAVETSAGDSITYGEILARAKKVSVELEHLSITPGALVGVMYKPGIDMITALLGTVLAGAGYLPLDPGFAGDRLKHMVEETRIPAILVQAEFRDLAATLFNDVAKVVQGQGENWSTETWIQKETSPGDPFYAIYTSVSKPKGVMLTNENTRAMLSSHGKRHDFSPRDRILFLTSFTWDVSVAQIWGSLTSGATMLLATEDVRKDPDALASFLLQSKVTVTYTTPTQYTSLLLSGKEKLSQCSDYRTAIFAGEALTARLVKETYGLGLDRLKIYNQYGPSEATVQTTSYEAPCPQDNDGYVSIGYGLPNCSHYAVDPKLQPVPETVIGELCEGGPQVGAGYVGRPEATARVFVDNPFAPREYRLRGWTAMYRTGDRVRFLPGGQMEYKGRISGDTQVKLRGFRIELGEIENEIASIAKNSATALPVVTEVAVICRRRGDANEVSSLEIDDRHLVAFLVASNVDASREKEKQELVNAIHEQLKARLNQYMLPSGYHLSKSLPTLPSGKRNRRLLQDIELDLVYPVSKRNPAADEGATEGTKGAEILNSVVDHFRKVLKLGPNQLVEPSSNFFDLGGHSLLVLRLAAQIKKEHKVKIEAKEIISDVTPHAVAQVVAGKLGIELSASPPQEVHVDWRAEACLPDEPSFYPAAERSGAAQVDGTAYILLTGADSATGIHILGRILNADTTTRIAVLGTESAITFGDLHARIRDYGIILNSPDDLANRVDTLPGSLCEPSLGLTDAAFEALGQTVSTIFHFGSQVSLLRSYTDLKRANILATQDIVRLASLGSRNTPIHYLSTWSVLHLQGWATSTRTEGAVGDSRIVKDERAPGFFTPTGNQFAYFKTRWAAEMMLSEAARRGFATTIYRTSGLDDHSSEDESSNFFLSLVRNILRTGVAPDFGNDDDDGGIWADFVSPKYISESVLRLSSADERQHGAAQIFHIRNPAAVPLRKLPQVLTGLGHEQRSLRVVPVDEWLAGLEGQGEVNVTVLREYLTVGHRMFSMDDAKTRQILGRRGVDAEDELRAVPDQLWRN